MNTLATIKRSFSLIAAFGFGLCAAANNAEAALPDGMVHHYDGENDAMDVVGNADGVPGATTAYAAGISGSGFSFDGAQSSIVTLPINIGPVAMPQMTVGMWVKMRSVANARGWVFGHDNGSYDRSINLTDVRYGSGVAGGTGMYPHASSLLKMGDNLDSWVCVAAAYDRAAKSATFYAQGKTQTVYATPGEGYATATLGGLRSFLNHTVDAVVDEVFMYDRVLGATEIDDACAYFADKDGDMVPDVNDACLDTPAGAIVSDLGCSGLQLIEATCGDVSEWPSGQDYFNCVHDVAQDAKDAGLISGKEYGEIVSNAAKAKN